MKRFTLFLLLSGLMLFTSCGKDKSRVDCVGYNFGNIISLTFDEVEDAYIDSVYMARFVEIPDAIVTEDYVYLYGKYEDLDKMILNACSLAEKELDLVQFKGFYDFVIHAVYITNVEAFFYEKAYGPAPTN